MCPERKRGVVGDHRLRYVGQLNRHTGVPGHAEAGQRGREAVDVLLELAVGEPGTEKNDGGGVPVLRCGALQKLRQRERFEVERRRHALVV